MPSSDDHCRDVVPNLLFVIRKLPKAPKSSGTGQDIGHRKDIGEYPGRDKIT
jgi:hypothetical protein